MKKKGEGKKDYVFIASLVVLVGVFLFFLLSTNIFGVEPLIKLRVENSAVKYEINPSFLSLFKNEKVQFAPDFSLCNVINNQGMTVLTSNVSCILVNSSNSIIDCAGWWLNPTGDAGGINIFEKQNVTVRNCAIWKSGGYGVYINNSVKVFVFNNSLFMSGMLLNNVNNSLLANNSISGSLVFNGFEIFNSINNSFISNILSSSKMLKGFFVGTGNAFNNFNYNNTVPLWT